jgi:hypothetical protein
MIDAKTPMSPIFRSRTLVRSVTEPTEGRHDGLRTQLTRCVIALLIAVPSFAYAEEDEPGSQPKSEEKAEAEADPPYRNPQGSVQVTGAGSISVGSESTSIAIGVGVGYAVVTGVVPGVRVVVISNDGLGAELAGTLTLTPPLSLYLVPFVVGEAGRRFLPGGGAWLYGGGGGVYIGEPESRVGLQLGWIFRRLVFENESFDSSGPIITISISF